MDSTRQTPQSETQSEGVNVTLSRLIDAHRQYFDIVEPFDYAGQSFEARGEFRTAGSRYVLVKRAKLWEVNSRELLFFKAYDSFDTQELRQVISFMQEEAVGMVNPGPNHMFTNLTWLAVCSKATDEAVRELSRARFRKNFAWGFRGWSDMRLAMVDLAHERIVTNRAAKDMIETLEANVAWSKKKARAKGRS